MLTATLHPDINNSINNKKRTIDDLIRYVRTCTEGNPNYLLLLGAGCSITSGICSASELIKIWRREIFESKLGQKCSYEEYSDEKAINYFKANCSHWYDTRNEYASLFEQKFDLPRQRRMFIEQEVSDKHPSIGYAYLIKLIKKNFFNTIFTTNYDDLLNEAFYTFSNERPIVCAHDSAINSITVTSKRPKIIKLHGDYLFDDIKSTLRETESLEENIKNKFAEFAKNHGLIVIGYGGNDRSVMDVLFHLLKQDDYFKNGIYWCLQRGSGIHSELLKLLLRDRVYLVEIDGFDELMAEFNSHLNNDELPISTSIISDRNDNLVEELLNNPFVNTTTSELIKRDLIRMRESKEENLIKKILASFEADSNNSETVETDRYKKIKRNAEKLNLNENVILLRLHEKVSAYKFVDVISDISKLINEHSGISKALKIELKKLEAICWTRLGDESKATSCYQDLLEIDKEAVNYYLNIARLTDDPNKKISFIDKALKLDEYASGLYASKARALIHLFKNSIDSNAKPQFDEIIQTLDIGIKRNPSINNPCWEVKYSFILDNEKDKTKRDDECKRIIEHLKEQNPHDIRFVELLVNFKVKAKEKGDEIVEIVEKAKSKSREKDKLDFDLLLLHTLSELNNKPQLEIQMKMMDKEYEDEDVYLDAKAQIILRKFNDLLGAIEITKNSIRLNPHQLTFRQLFKFYLYARLYDDAKQLLNNKIGGDKRELEIDYFEARGEYRLAYDIVRGLSSEQPNDKGFVIQQAYFLIKLNRLQEAHVFMRKYLEYSNFSEPILVVNYELGNKLLKNKINEDRLQRAKSHPDSTNLVKAAISILEGKKREALEYLEKEEDENCESKYTYRDWIVFEEILSDDKFKHLFHD